MRTCGKLDHRMGCRCDLEQKRIEELEAVVKDTLWWFENERYIPDEVVSRAKELLKK